MNTHKVGSDVVFGDFPYTSEDGCREVSNQQIVCDVAGGRFLFRNRGYEVTYHLRNGKLKNATVVRTYGP